LCRLKGCPVIVFGRSLGGAVSFYLAEKFPKLVHGIIVENTFLSISAMVDILMPYIAFPWLKSFILKLDWGTDRIINRVKQPIFFISGKFNFNLLAS
jgi:pimeloyl-ACP methyl ester carboxylesterase